MEQTALQQIEQTGVVAILRGIEQAYFEKALHALYDGGIRCVEITLNTPGALEMIETARRLYGGRIALGAGTVLEEMSAHSAILAGANFLLAPTLSVKVIGLCATYNCLAIPGVFTATEALTAWQAGARMVKIFPCSSVGPSYIKDLRGPLAQIKMMPVGGVSLQNAAAFFEAGASAIGVGASLFDSRLAREGRFEELTERAANFIALAAGRTV